MRRPVFSAVQFGAQEWLKYFAAFDLTVPSIVFLREISNRYLLRLVYSSPGSSVRPVYSTMRTPYLIGSSAKTPSPVRERPTLRAKRESMRRRFFFFAAFFIASYETASADSCKGLLWNYPRVTGANRLRWPC